MCENCQLRKTKIKQKKRPLLNKPINILQREPKYCHRDEITPRGSITREDIDVVENYLKQKSLHDDKENDILHKAAVIKYSSKDIEKSKCSVMLANALKLIENEEKTAVG